MTTVSVSANPGAQLAFMRDREHKHPLFAAGWGAGKTWAGARKLVIELVAQAPANVLAIGPTYGDVKAYMLPHLLDALEEMRLNATLRWGDKEVEIPHVGSKIFLRSADKPSTITGFEVGSFWADEIGRWPRSSIPQEDAWLQAQGRLRHPAADFHQGFATSTHEGDDTIMYDLWEDDPDPGYVIYRGSTFENPSARGFAEDMEERLGEELAEQYVHGHALDVRGKSAYRFRSSRDTAPVGILHDLPLWHMWDFNVDPAATVVGQLGMDGTLRIIDEFYLTGGSTTREMASDYCDQYGDHKMGVNVYGDASGRSRSSKVGWTDYEVIREVFRQRGVPRVQMKHLRKNPRIKDRVNSVNALLQKGKLLVNPEKCPMLVRDLRKVRWEHLKSKASAGDLTHLTDALGYGVYKELPVGRDAISTHWSD